MSNPSTTSSNFLLFGIAKSGILDLGFSFFLLSNCN